MRRFEGYMRGVNLGGWLSQADETTKEHYDTFITEADIKRRFKLADLFGQPGERPSVQPGGNVQIR